AAQLEDEGCYPVQGNRWNRGAEAYVPLYEGKMVQAFDHRASSVVVNPENLNRPAHPREATPEEHANPNWLPDPQFWIDEKAVEWPEELAWAVGFKDVTAPTNVRTMIASIVPRSGVGNTLPLLIPDPADVHDYRESACLWVACMNSFAFDFIARQKVQGQHLNWFIVEQLPVIAPDAYDRRFGGVTAADLVRDHVLRLTYTAHDMEPFARDLGYGGPPFTWDEEERRHLRARLDALYFHLYGLDRADAAYVLDTFPIVRREDEAQFNGRYRTKDLILAYMNALAVADTETIVSL
ncbi:MAG: restriction endonuclease, partial [Chloroflexi bacterium]|nr:restriction endonuclease [Chloroflexota bacterium]